MSENATKGLIAKAKRRIKRFIRTGIPQARVRENPDGTYLYRVRHDDPNTLSFKRDSIGRLIRI